MGEWQTVKAENLVRHKNGNYYLRAKVAGKIIRRSLHTDQMRIAKIKRDALLARLRSVTGTHRKGSPLGRDKAIAITRIHYQSDPGYQAKPASMHYRETCLRVLESTLPARAVSYWTVNDMRTWWTSPAIARYSATRRNGMLGTLRTLIRLAIEQGARYDDPTSGIKLIPVRSKPVSPPSRADFVRIVADIRRQGKRASTESANFVEFLAYSGCRISEAQSVQWKDVDKQSITITGGETGTKNHEIRRVPIIPPMRELLDRMRPETASGPLWSIKTPRIALDNACARLGVSHIRIHDLRHLFATACIEAGVDIPTLSRWLGHKDGGLLALKTYGHLRDEHSQAQAAKVVF